MGRPLDKLPFSLPSHVTELLIYKPGLLPGPVAGAGGGGGLLSALLARRRSQDGGRAAAGAVIVESSSDEELPLSPYQPAAAAPPGQRAQMVRLVHEAEGGCGAFP